MKITFEINDHDLQTNILQYLMSRSEGIPVEMTTSPQEDPPKPAEPRPGTAAKLLNDPTQPGGEAAVIDPIIGGQAAPEAGTVAEVIAGIKLKPTTGTTISNGTGKTGDEVETAAGETGVIAATFRGKIVVEFEDGSDEIIPGGELTLTPQTDATPGAGLNGAADNAVMSEANSLVLREKANGIITGGKALSKDVFALLSQYDVKNFDDLPAHSYAAIDTALDTLAGVAAPSAHGF